MAMYGLAVFLETREHLKKGRLLYIAISFVLVALTAFKASVKASWAFKLLFEGTSPQDSVQLAKKYWLSWDRIATDVSLVILVFIGDALLVLPFLPGIAKVMYSPHACNRSIAAG